MTAKELKDSLEALEARTSLTEYTVQFTYFDEDAEEYRGIEIKHFDVSFSEKTINLTD